MEERGYIYILTNRHNRVLYVGVTSKLSKRISDHRHRAVASFARKYNLSKIVYFEDCGNIINAIEREKQLKGGSRKKKIDLINSINPDWLDLTLYIRD